VTINRPDGEVSYQHHQDWSFRIETPTGGLIETDFPTCRLTYEAPAAGYVPICQAEISAAGFWQAGVHKVVFLTSRAGQVYAKLDIGLFVSREPATLNGPYLSSYSAVHPAHSNNRKSQTRPASLFAARLRSAARCRFTDPLTPRATMIQPFAPSPGFVPFVLRPLFPPC